MTEPVTHQLEVPGAVLAYDVRTGSDPERVPLVMIGSPAGAVGFTTLAGHFTDRTVVTYDPRHSGERSRLTTDDEPTPYTHADDVHRVIGAAVGDGPVDLLASSGGAVNALALVAAHPSTVRVLVAHEPPLISQLPDRDAATRATLDIQDQYERDGIGPAMARFLALIMLRGEVSADWSAQPAPDPAAFGLPTEDDGSRDDPMLGRHNLAHLTAFEPDYAALLASGTRLVVAVGAESEGELAHRGGLAAAAALGLDPIVFPSHHGGYLGGEYGQTGEPDTFAARLRELLDDRPGPGSGSGR